MQFTNLPRLLALAPLVAGQLSIYPPGGSGTIAVSIRGDTEPTGCIDAAGQWTVNQGRCASVGGNGQGGLGGPDGFYILNSSDIVTTTTVTWSTAWVGTHVFQGRTAYDLIANIGGSPTGGPVWYASEVPENDDSVALSGTASAGAVEINLTFQSTA
ncbi:hypothetical protein BKA67DRAFT_542005 [Truncatella angustata]|uniref:Uncharacterized protein n=1 Tax=Truncatella angustata TaxID=152316 RepID=A0A9P8U8B1_9PEZI|nr:uncharacterized protein BKA67DRAFT_542005 [Truncatella angustata]KAH6645019.1 hypothetical protein BKA67DRAFT_542005 [Truncatella angustata]KAH8201068.1 hypothetical protein TruAng_004764 [Truncatella angustata]